MHAGYGRAFSRSGLALLGVTQRRDLRGVIVNELFEARLCLTESKLSPGSRVCGQLDEHGFSGGRIPSETVETDQRTQALDRESSISRLPDVEDSMLPLGVRRRDRRVDL